MAFAKPGLSVNRPHRTQFRATVTAAFGDVCCIFSLVIHPCDMFVLMRNDLLQQSPCTRALVACSTTLVAATSKMDGQNGMWPSEPLSK
mmetsp:Transcript_8652/g.20383  ORF Transcript_8652/g.20383 Transcript_8652/m.20383 type:complete len:89 (-) Transcript_8652:56-322(-)